MEKVDILIAEIVPRITDVGLKVQSILQNALLSEGETMDARVEEAYEDILYVRRRVQKELDRKMEKRDLIDYVENPVSEKEIRIFALFKEHLYETLQEYLKRRPQVTEVHRGKPYEDFIDLVKCFNMSNALPDTTGHSLYTAEVYRTHPELIEEFQKIARTIGEMLLTDLPSIWSGFGASDIESRYNQFMAYVAPFFTCGVDIDHYYGLDDKYVGPPLNFVFEEKLFISPKGREQVIEVLTTIFGKDFEKLIQSFKAVEE